VLYVEYHDFKRFNFRSFLLMIRLITVIMDLCMLTMLNYSDILHVIIMKI